MTTVVVKSNVMVTNRLTMKAFYLFLYVVIHFPHFLTKFTV